MNPLAARTIVVGATGATGRLLVAELLRQGREVVAIVRTPDRLPSALRNHGKLTFVPGSPLRMSSAELVDLVAGCEAVASCLGHNLNLRGVYGQPRRLVTGATRRLCDAILAGRPAKPVKLVLMNTAGVSNRDLEERRTLAEEGLAGLLRWLLPPHADNEQAADYLRTAVGNGHPLIRWVVVRPDTLIDKETVTAYELHPSPVRSALFNPGKTSRINVAHFMAELIGDPDLWTKWQGGMPVIYNRE